MPERKEYSMISEAIDSIGAFVRFIRHKTNSGLLLIGVTIVAILWANSAYGESYFRLWETHLGLRFGSWSLDKPLYYWINDGLMAVFFFVIGLEIKRELMLGQISTPRKAALPVFAALGGMVMPALFFLLFNTDSGHANGWGITIATDIAFSLGILALLGKRIPLGVKTFLTAFAIVDDLGAVSAIAVFYTDNINFVALGIALTGFLLMIIMNRLGVRSVEAYLIMAILLLWYPMLMSGVHATVAGVLAAITIPVKRKIKGRFFIDSMHKQTDAFGKECPRDAMLLSGSQLEAIEEMKTLCEKSESPLQRMEHRLHPIAIYVIMPLFALTNTGIVFDPKLMGDAFTHPLSLGIIFGLVLGKFIGIGLFSWLAVHMGWATLPGHFRWSHMLGVSLLAGVGFTMSLFIADLAFHGHHLQGLAKLAIFIASFIAGLAGYLVLRLSIKKAGD